MDDADANNGAVWTRVNLPAERVKLVDDERTLSQEQWERINDHPLLASADSKEVEAVQEGKCLCGQPLAEETVILSNSGGNLAIMCSGECFDDFMMLGLLQQIGEGVAERIQTRGLTDEPG